MAVFEYHALERSGKKVNGVIDADSPVAARRKLRDQELYPTDVQASGLARGGVAPGGADRAQAIRLDFVTVRDLALATRQLAVLLEAGMPLAEALSATVEQSSRAALKNALFDIRDRVMEGATFADSLESHAKIFSSLYVNMVRAGEASGTLEPVLFRLVDILEHQARMKNKVLSTLAYPAFMLTFSLGIISFLMMVIVPRITSLFERLGQELPQLTRILIATTDILGAYWYLMLGAVVLAYMSWRYWISTPQGRLAWDRFKLRVPLLGTLHLKLVCGRFARILGSMLESGLTMMKALDVVSTVVQNRHIEKTMEEVKAGVRRGRDLAAPMEESGVFPPLLIQMVELGQRSGQIESMLLKAADTYDEDVQLTVDALVSLLEPIIIVVMGVFIGMLVLSILLPILNMSTNIGM